MARPGWVGAARSPLRAQVGMPPPQSHEATTTTIGQTLKISRSGALTICACDVACVCVYACAFACPYACALWYAYAHALAECLHILDSEVGS